MSCYDEDGGDDLYPESAQAPAISTRGGGSSIFAGLQFSGFGVSISI